MRTHTHTHTSTRLVPGARIVCPRPQFTWASQPASQPSCMELASIQWRVNSTRLPCRPLDECADLCAFSHITHLHLPIYAGQNAGPPIPGKSPKGGRRPLSLSLSLLLLLLLEPWQKHRLGEWPVRSAAGPILFPLALERAPGTPVSGPPSCTALVWAGSEKRHSTRQTSQGGRGKD